MNDKWKTKDHAKARADLEELDIRPEQHSDHLNTYIYRYKHVAVHTCHQQHPVTAMGNITELLLHHRVLLCPTSSPKSQSVIIVHI